MAKNNCILIIDDDHEIALGASLRLQAAGYDTIRAHSGNEGVSAAVEHLPQAIVMDVRMPFMDGMQALAELRRNQTTRKIPIVMLSASIVDEQAALDQGACFFIKKPYQASSLIAAVIQAMAGREVPAAQE